MIKLEKKGAELKTLVWTTLLSHLLINATNYHEKIFNLITKRLPDLVQDFLISLSVGSIAYWTHSYLKSRKIIDAQSNTMSALEREQVKANTLNKLLRLLSSNLSLNDILTTALNIIFEDPLLSVEKKWAIFAFDHQTNNLKMLAQIGMDWELAEKCKELKPGQCVCWQVAKTKCFTFVKPDDPIHSQAIPAGKEHWHYGVPLVDGSNLYWVLNLYLHPDHPGSDKDEISHIESIGAVISLLIQSFKAGALESLKWCENMVIQCSSLADADRCSEVVSNVFPIPLRVRPWLLELIINGLEHWIAGITYEEKKKLRRSELESSENAWMKEVNRRLALPENKGKSVTISVQRTIDYIAVTIADPGNWFRSIDYIDFSMDRIKDPNWKWISVISRCAFDSLRYNDKGNQVTAKIYTN